MALDWLLPCWLLAMGLVGAGIVFWLGFCAGRTWADKTTLPPWFPRWLMHLLNWRRGT